MSLEQELFDQRLARIDEIESLGLKPYGQRFEFSHTLTQILDQYSSKAAEELNDRVDVKICGRIQTVRRMGKAGFLHLQQGSVTPADLRQERRGLRGATSRSTRSSTLATSSESRAIFSVLARANSAFT